MENHSEISSVKTTCNTAKKATLCWDCQLANGRCSWSDEFKPVKGWNATPTQIKSSAHNVYPIVHSYVVHDCPLFLRDEPRKPRKIVL